MGSEERAYSPEEFRGMLVRLIRREAGAKTIIRSFSRGGVSATNTTLEHLGLFSNDDNMDDDLPQIYDFLEPEGRAARG